MEVLPPYNPSYVTTPPLRAAPFAQDPLTLNAGEFDTSAPPPYEMHSYGPPYNPPVPPAEILDYFSRFLAGLTPLDHVVICEPPHCQTAPAIFDICTERAGQRWPIFRGEEESTSFSTDCIGMVRGFEIVFKNQQDQEVLLFRRPACHCAGFCLPCFCLDGMKVESPPGNAIGTVSENWTFCGTSLTLKEPRGQPIFNVTAGCFAAASGSDHRTATKFKITDICTSSKVGEIVRQYSPPSGSDYVYNTTFVNFPNTEPVQWKALKIATAILLNYRLFSTPERARN